MKRLLLAVTALSLVATTVQADQMVGVTKYGPFSILVGFDSDSPLVPNYARLITGLNNREAIIGLDARPATGQLYAIGTTPGTSNTSSSFYEIDLETGEATPVVSDFTPELTKDAGVATKFGFDFNPTIDRARLVSDRDQNLVFNPTATTVTPATPLFYVAADDNFGENPNVTHIAYTNNFQGATTSQLYAIDTELGILATLANSTGVLATVGSLGFDVKEAGGFDITSSGEPLAILTPEFLPIQLLFEIDLETGAAEPVGIPAFGVLDLQGLTSIDFLSAPTVAAE